MNTDDQEDEQDDYVAQLIHHWEPTHPRTRRLSLIVTKNDEELAKFAKNTVLRRENSENNYRLDWIRRFKFDPMNPTLEIDLPVVAHMRKWSIIPKTTNTDIRKEDVDQFTMDPDIDPDSTVPCVQVYIMAGASAEATCNQHIDVRHTEPDLSFDMVIDFSTKTST